MNKDNRIRWSEMENLYCWFLDKFEDTEFEKFFKEEESFPLRQTLKKKLKKYIVKKENFKYYKLALHIFNDCFKGDDRVRELPEPFNIEIELLRYLKHFGYGVHIGNEERFISDTKMQRKNMKKNDEM